MDENFSVEGGPGRSYAPNDMVDYTRVMEEIVIDEAEAAHKRLVTSMTQGVWMDIQRRFRAVMDKDGAQLVTNPDVPEAVSALLVSADVEALIKTGGSETALIQLASDCVGLIIRRRLQRQQRTADKA